MVLQKNTKYLWVIKQTINDINIVKTTLDFILQKQFQIQY